MSKKTRQERKAAKEDRAALAKAKADAAALDTQSFATLEEANAALADVAHVITMQEGRDRMAKKQRKSGTATVAKVERKSAGAGSGKLPNLPKKAGAKRAQPTRLCECGCGGTTKSRFVPGHDSYLRGLVLRVHRDATTLADVEKLGGKDQREAVKKEMAKLKAEGKLPDIKPVAAKVAKVAKGKAKVAKPEEAVAGIPEIEESESETGTEG